MGSWSLIVRSLVVLLIVELQVAGEAEVDAAVAAARAAFTGPWSKFTIVPSQVALLTCSNNVEKLFSKWRISSKNISQKWQNWNPFKPEKQLRLPLILRCLRRLSFSDVFVPLAPLMIDYAGWIDKVEGESFIDNVEGMIKVCQSISILISDCQT
jgi:aldehyde dehydrogenase (NAD+)